MERLETTVQRYNWATRRIIGAHGAGERIYSILFLFMLIFANNVQFARAAGTNKQLSPTVTFSYDSKTSNNEISVDATVGQLKFTRPTLNITVDGKSASRYFSVNWSFENGKDSTDTNGRTYSIDKKTGSVITKLYDGVVIGDTVGTAKVIVTLSIAPRYADTYDFASDATTTASYTINVKAPAVTVEYYNGSTLLNGTTKKGLQFYCLNNQTTTCNVPTHKLYYTLDNSTYDVSSYYDYTYSVTNGYSLSSDNKTISTSLNTSEGGTGTLTITATPKTEYQHLLGDTVRTTTIDLTTTYRTEKLKTYISFAKNEVDALKFRNIAQDKAGEEQFTYSPDVIVTDENGNDISNLINNINWKVSAEDAFNKYSHDPNDSVVQNYIYYGALIDTTTHHNPWTPSVYTVFKGDQHYGRIQHTRPDDYLITATATISNTTLYETPVPAVDENGTEKTTKVNGQFYGNGNDLRTSKDNVYTVKSNELIFRERKRVPAIHLSPEPNTVTLAEDYEMNAFNRFHISGKITDPYDPEDPIDTASNFHYKFFLPDSMAYGITHDSKNVQIEVTNTPAEYPGKSAWEWVPAYHNGVIETNADRSTKYELVHGTYYDCLFGFNTNYDTFKMKFHGRGKNVPIVYTILPWTPQKMDVGISGVYQFEVVEKEPTYFVIDPKSQLGSVGSTLPCPSIKVEDQFGVDVTDQFDVTRAQSKTSSEWTLNADGSVTSNKEGEYTVNVNGTLKSTSTQPFENPSQATYEMIFKGSTGSTAAYEVIYDDKHDVKMGKLHFIKEGSFYPGTTSYHEVPGINITFGSAKDTEDGNVKVWTLVKSSATNPSYFSDDKVFHGADNLNDWTNQDSTSTTRTLSKMSIRSDETTFDSETNLPTGGGFLKIDAITNGWLYLDAYFPYDTDNKKPFNYFIVDASSKESQAINYIKDTSNPSGDNIAEIKFPKPLLAGHSYYVYSNSGSFRLHGLRYEPGFIDPVTDDLPWGHTGAVDLEPVEASTAFLNGYTGTLPTLAFHREDATVKWYCEDVLKTNTSTSLTISDLKECTDSTGMHVWISNNNGIVLGKKMTNEAPLTDASRTGFANGRVKVYAKVMGIKKTEGQVMKEPKYYLFVGDMPTYIVQEGENHDQDERVSTTNIPTRIWMTFGGWHWTGDKTYPYYKNNDPAKAWIDDEWKTAKMDSVGHNEQTIDGFNYICWGGQDPSDETVKSWNNSDRNTFNLPVRGAYLKFEPEESGGLLLYVCMNGMTDNAKGDTETKLTKNGPWLRRRALFIVDETGTPVAIDANSGWQSKYNWSKYVNSGKTNSNRFSGYTNWYQNYYCDGVTRCAWNYDGTKELSLNAEKGGKYSWFSSYDRNHDGKLDSNEHANFANDSIKIHEWWTSNTYSHPDKTADEDVITMNFSHTKLDGPLELIQLSDSSYVLPTKGYVRFTFQVYAGKVYYVFMTGSKLGFCGFGFIPSSYRANMNRWTDHSNEAKNADGTAFTDATYAKLPQPDATTDNLYLSGESGNGRLMGGSKTLDVALTADNPESYAKWKEKGFLLSGETDASSGISATTNSARDFMNVTLKRSFRNKRWAGICLPFTVSETQMKSIFGNDMQLITVDSVMASKDHERTLHFTQHVNQLLEAGRPYLIYPNVSSVKDGEPIGESSTDSDGKTTYSVTFYRVTVESVEPKTVIMKNEDVIAHNESVTAETAKDKVDIFTYKVCGQYDKAIIPWYSYYMKNSENADDNKFYRIVKPSGSTATGRSLPGYNIYLFPYSTDPEGKDLIKTGETTSPAKIADFWITGAEVAGNSTTAIDEIVDDLNEATTAAFAGVYDLQGRQVRSTNDLQGLAPGIYLMGGHKYVVK